MVGPLPDRITCFYSDRIAGTLVFDPAEANPAGAPAGPYVRLYDTGPLQLSPWVELAWNSLDPVTSEPVIAIALDLYARRKEREEEARLRRARLQRRRFLEARNAQAAEEKEARDAARAVEAARRAAAEAEEAARARAADADARARLHLAAERHRDSESDDAVLQVFELDGDATPKRRSAILYDPQGHPGGDDSVVFTPFGEAPLTMLKGARHPSEHRGARLVRSKSQRRKIISRYRAWQAGEIEAKRRQALREAFHAALSAARTALQKPLEDSLPLDRVPLMRSDILLALNWCRDENAALHDLLRERLGRCAWQRFALEDEVRQSYRKDEEWPADLTLFKKMLSARLAEKAVKQFYEKHDPALAASGRRLIDMSIRQVKNGQPFDPRYDLGYPEDVDRETSAAPKRLDVKNTQLDPKDPNGYSRHYVKKLRVLNDGSTVRIVGAVSEITTLADVLAGHGRVRILGEVDAARIEGLQREYGLTYLKLELTRDGKPGQFFAPWIFGGLPFVVSSRIQSLDALRTAYDAHPDPETAEPVPIPIALAAGIPLHPVQRTALSAGQRALSDMLLRPNFVSRRSLPDLYLTLLRQFFVLVAGPPEARAGYDPAEYHELLFLDAARPEPLGMPDPLRSVAGLLESLSRLLEHGWEKLAEFESFEFRGAGILYGCKANDPDTRWTLMYTHCGQVGRCRGKRLVIGQERLCERCHHLICRMCSFCTSGCAGSKE